MVSELEWHRKCPHLLQLLNDQGALFEDVQGLFSSVLAMFEVQPLALAQLLVRVRVRVQVPDLGLELECGAKMVRLMVAVEYWD